VREKGHQKSPRPWLLFVVVVYRSSSFVVHRLLSSFVVCHRHSSFVICHHCHCSSSVICHPSFVVVIRHFLSSLLFIIRHRRCCTSLSFIIRHRRSWSIVCGHRPSSIIVVCGRRPSFVVVHVRYSCPSFMSVVCRHYPLLSINVHCSCCLSLFVAIVVNHRSSQSSSIVLCRSRCPLSSPP